MMWKVVVTFIVVIHLVISLPVEQEKCHGKRKFCEGELNRFLCHLCGNKEYDVCPTADDPSMPKILEVSDAKSNCCKIGCSASYLKYVYCTLISLPMPKTVNRLRYEFPPWLKFFSSGGIIDEWFEHFSSPHNSKPIYQ